VEWIQLAQNSVQWWPLVNTIMNLKGSTDGGEVLVRLKYQFLKEELVELGMQTLKVIGCNVIAERDPTV